MKPRDDSQLNNYSRINSDELRSVTDNQYNDAAITDEQTGGVETDGQTSNTDVQTNGVATDNQDNGQAGAFIEPPKPLTSIKEERDKKKKWLKNILTAL